MTPNAKISLNAEVEEKTKAYRALAKAKKIEAGKIKRGYAYVKIAHNTQILVPCDKSGKPTKEGLRRIEMHNKALGKLKLNE